MKASDFISRYEAYCPRELSMEGDISGLQVGSLDKPIHRVMIALDIREATVAEAIAASVDLIVVKHAPVFKPLKDLVATPQNNIYFDLIKHDIAVYVSHTNIDVVPDGLNDWFCELLGIVDTEILHPTSDGYGIGRVGNVPEQSLETFALKVKEVFQLDSVRLVSYQKIGQPVRRVAICGGSGQGFYPDALAKNADVYITGDIYYHTAQEMLTNGLLAIDPGHHIEVLFTRKLVEKCQIWKEQEKWDVDFLVSQAQTNPFYHL